MKTYEIEIQEFLARVVKVEATDVNDAIAKVSDKYEKAQIVLNYKDFAEVNFIDINRQSKEDKIKMLIREIIQNLNSNKGKYLEQFDKQQSSDFFKKVDELKSLIEID